jgi:hypothetical protein
MNGMGSQANNIQLGERNTEEVNNNLDNNQYRQKQWLDNNSNELHGQSCQQHPPGEENTEEVNNNLDNINRMD